MNRFLLTLLAVAQAIVPSPATAAESTSVVDFLVKVAKESCYAIGDDVPRLATYASQKNWSIPPSDMLKRFSSPAYTLTGGWTFQAFSQPFVVQQTHNAADGSRSCSITTKMKSEGDYEQFKALWDESHTILKHSDRVSPNRLMHFDSLRRSPPSDVASTISFDRNAATLTVLVTAPALHGRDGTPPSSGTQPNS